MKCFVPGSSLAPRAAWRLPLLALGCLTALGGCASTKKDGPKKSEASLLGIEVVGDTTTERYDLNGDGRPDFFKTFVLRGPKTDPDTREPLLAREELDLDFDGTVDVRRTYNEAGQVVREDMDLDFDGRFDATDYYADGQLYRRDMAMNFEGQPSIRKFYTQGKLTRKERDTNADGVMDSFEFYEEGKLVRLGIDKDGDGRPDVYTEVEE